VRRLYSAASVRAPHSPPASSRERGRLTPHQSPSGDSFPSRGSLLGVADPGGQPTDAPTEDRAAAAGGPSPSLRSTGCPWVRVQGRATHGRPYGSYIQPHRPFTPLRLPISAPVSPHPLRLPVSAPVPPPPRGCRLAHPSPLPLPISAPVPPPPAAAAQDVRKQCGDFAGDSFRFSGNSKESPATGAAPLGSRSHNPQRSSRGPGGRAFFASPRRLSAAFDARKRPASNKRYNTQNANTPTHAAQPPAGCVGLVVREGQAPPLHAATPPVCTQARIQLSRERAPDTSSVAIRRQLPLKGKPLGGGEPCRASLAPAKARIPRRNGSNPACIPRRNPL